MKHSLVVFVLLVLSAAACGDNTPTKAEHPVPVPPGAEPAVAHGDHTAPGDQVAPPPAKPALLAEPRLDLTANQVRFHLYDKGLVIPVGGEGIDLYALDYKRSWGDVMTVQDVETMENPKPGGPETGRKLKKGASLIAPWPGGAGQIAIRFRAMTMTVRVDGKVVKTAIGGNPGVAWGTVTFDLPATLSAGDHRFSFDAKSNEGPPLIESVELIPAAGAGAATPCAGEPLPRSALAADGALGGWPRLDLMTEIPTANGYLAVTPTGGGAAAITARVEGEADSRTLWSGTADGGERVVDLAPIAGKLVALSFTGGCSTRWTKAAIAVAARDVPAAAAPVKNVILIVIDTLRGDRVAAMGATRVETPRFTALAAKGVAFRRHQSMAPSSPPSHASIQTGQIPRVHGVTGDDGQMKPDAPILSRILHDAGLWTGYVGDNDFAMGRFKKLAAWDEAHTPTFEGKGLDCVAVFEGALALVKKARAANQRYFISVLPIQPHEPYRYHEGITEKYFPGPFPKPVGKRVVDLGRFKKRGLTDTQWDQLRGLYDGEVTYVDSTCYPVLEDGLAELGALDDTAIILTSDHGEGMGERNNNVGHAYSLNRELIAVPLIIVAPGLAPRTIDTATSAADIAPTVLDLLGFPVDPRMQGASLLPLARTGDAIPRVIASEYGRAYALRGAHWRYMVGYDDKGVLYDIDADPIETKDAGRDAPIALRYLRDAAGLYLAHRNDWRATTWGTLADLAPGGPLAK